MIIIVATAILFIFCVYKSYRKNFYLGFVQAISSLNLIIALTIIKKPADQFILVLGGVLTIVTTHAFFSRGLADLQESYFFIKKINKSTRRLELTVLFIFLMPFYIVLLPHILSGGWWSEIESRVAYMTGLSFWLRGVKLTPILIGMIIFSMFDKLDKNKFTWALISTFIFVIFYGSKSGAIFLIALFSLYLSVNIQAKRDILIPSLLIGILLLSSLIFFFYKVGSESGTSLVDELLARFSSNVLGYVRAFDDEYSSVCSTYNMFSPMVGTLSKALPFLVDAPTSHLSMGKCLASPYSVEYEFELLLPLFFELYIIYGASLSILIYMAMLIFIWGFFIFFKKLGGILNVRYTAFCTRVLILILSLSIFWGGKIANFLVSDALSSILMLLIVGFIINILPVRQIFCQSRREKLVIE